MKQSEFRKCKEVFQATYYHLQSYSIVQSGRWNLTLIHHRFLCLYWKCSLI